MNYKIITDEGLLDNFIESLPNLSKDEVFYVCLFARSKYLTEEQRGQISHIKSDKAQLKRFTATKETLKTKLKQLECPLGSYVQYKTDVPIDIVPQEALATYITINPRSLSLATRNSLKKFVEMVADNPTHSFNPSNFAMSEIQRSPKKNKKWHVIDVDSKDVNVKSILAQCLGNTPYKILETRGGFHCLIDLHNIDESIKKNWYNNLKSSFGKYLDQCGDLMIPILGTHQGGFTPRFISKNSYEDINKLKHTLEGNGSFVGIYGSDIPKEYILFNSKTLNAGDILTNGDDKIIWNGESYNIVDSDVNNFLSEDILINKDWEIVL